MLVVSQTETGKGGNTSGNVLLLCLSSRSKEVAGKKEKERKNKKEKKRKT